MSIADALERIADRLSSASGFDTSLPALEAASHGVRIEYFLPCYPGIFVRCNCMLANASKGWRLPVVPACFVGLHCWIAGYVLWSLVA